MGREGTWKQIKLDTVESIALMALMFIVAGYTTIKLLSLKGRIHCLLVSRRGVFAKEKPRRHLFFDKGMECWCIAHICHSDEGVYAKSGSTSVQSNYLTMGQDQKARSGEVGEKQQEDLMYR